MQPQRHSFLLSLAPSLPIYNIFSTSFNCRHLPPFPREALTPPSSQLPKPSLSAHVQRQVGREEAWHLLLLGFRCDSSCPLNPGQEGKPQPLRVSSASLQFWVLGCCHHISAPSSHLSQPQLLIMHIHWLKQHSQPASLAWIYSISEAQVLSPTIDRALSGPWRKSRCGENP